MQASHAGHLPDAPLLEMRSISKSFPGVQALHQVSLELRAGEVRALVGENGAGKSTLIKLLAGVYQPTEGQILLDGQPQLIRDPAHALRLGIVPVHQEVNLEPYLSIAENILIGRQPRNRFGLIDFGQMNREAARWLAELGVATDPALPLGMCSIAERQMVAIARAVSLDARVVIFDEPTSSLTLRETERLFSVIRRLQAKKIAVLYISHRMEEIFQICDTLTVLRDGALVATQTLDTVTTDSVIRMMIGRELQDLYQKQATAVGPPVLEVKQLTVQGILNDISLTLHRGEILGVAGLVGAGRTELARSLCRIDPLHSGTVTLDGAPVARGGPSAAIRSGLAYLTEDRKGDGLALRLTVSDNVLAAATPGRTQKGWLAPRSGGVAALLDQLAVQPRDPRRQAAGLSGGNQQKALLARWLAVNPEVLFLDEPTRGVDVAAKAAIHEAIVRLAEAGKCIVLVSSDLPELVALSDRVLVMRQGRVAAELDREQCSEEAVLLAANGRPVPAGVRETRAGTPVPPDMPEPHDVPEPTERAEPVARSPRHEAAGRRWLAPAAAVVVLAVVAMLAPRALFSPANLLSVVQAVAILGVVACGVCFTTYTGHYADLSVPSAMAFSGIVTIWALPHGLGPALAAGLGVGLAVGLVNGAAIGWLRVNPIIWTLATGAAVGGLIRWVFSGEQVYPDEALAAGRTFLDLYGGKVWGPVTLAVAAMAAAAVAAAALLRGTLFGFQARLTGASYEAARLSGAPVGGVVAGAFALSGLAAAVGGILLASLNKVGAPYIGKGYDFLAVTAIVLGGMSLAGGRGGAGGVLGGVLVIGLLRSAMNLIGLNSFLQEIAQGMVFIAVVGAHAMLLRRQGLDDA